jgi:hypothetical protein
VYNLKLQIQGQLSSGLPSRSLRNSREDELAAELESHIEMQVEDNVRAGMSPEEDDNRVTFEVAETGIELDSLGGGT